MAVPVKFRDELSLGAIVTRGGDGCLTIYKIGDWEVLVEKLQKLPQSRHEVRNYTRLLLSGAVEAKVDKQGRINLPKYLIDFANLSKKVVFVGVNDKLEIWDEMKWNDYKSEVENQSVDMLEQLGDYGL